jgi:FAD/FMN-containing dehydrogenase
MQRSSHVTRVLELDEVSLAARIQAGATGPELERQLAAHERGLHWAIYAPCSPRSLWSPWGAARGRRPMAIWC